MHAPTPYARCCVCGPPPPLLGGEVALSLQCGREEGREKKRTRQNCTANQLHPTTSSRYGVNTIEYSFDMPLQRVCLRCNTNRLIKNDRRQRPGSV